MIKILKSKASKMGVAVQLVFQITQHSRDELLMMSLIEYFNCGNISKSGETFKYLVTKLLDIETKIIPFFQTYKIEGIKQLDFEDFCQVAKLMKHKAHFYPPLTPQSKIGE